jgi:SAUR family protein
MDVITKEKGKKGLIIKTWERCKSIGQGRKRSSGPAAVRVLTMKSKSWPSIEPSLEAEEKRARKRRVVPEGCFSVYVGPQKQKFVIKTEYANHPLFQMLLEEAESEYGYNNQGPLVLPCNVDIFYKVLLEMEDGHEIHPGCGLKRYASYHLLSPSRMLATNSQF